MPFRVDWLKLQRQVVSCHIHASVMSVTTGIDLVLIAAETAMIGQNCGIVCCNYGLVAY